MARVLREISLIDASKPTTQHGCELIFHGRTTKGVDAKFKIELDAWSVGYLGEQLRGWMVQLKDVVAGIERDLMGR